MLLKRLLLPLTLVIVSGTFLLLATHPAQADPPVTNTTDTDVSLNIEPVIGLYLTTCNSMDNATVVLNITLPTAMGKFASNCQNLSIDTNAPGYQLHIRAEGSHPTINSGNLTNALIYQNPTTTTPVPIVPATTNPINTPDILQNNTWGFAVTSKHPTTGVTLSSPMDSFTNTTSDYTNLTNETNKYSTLPTTNTLVYSTNDLPGQDTFEFYYGARITSAKQAGMYQTNIIYTAITNDIPPPPTYCGTFDYECIMFTIELDENTSGQYHIPTNGYVVNGLSSVHNYDWDVYINGVLTTDCPAGNCTGTSSNGSAGVPLPGLGIGTHKIKILPHGEPEPGWGNAFGHAMNFRIGGVSKAATISIDAPLTTMAFAPKTTESTTNASYMFAYLFYDCNKLTKPIKIIDTYKLPSSISNLSRFLGQTHGATYYDRSQLTTAVDLSPLSGWLDNNNSITDLSFFLYGTHGNNWLLTTPVTLPSWSFSSVTNLSNFLSSTHGNNTLLTTPINLVPLTGWFNSNNSITNLSNFLNSTHTSTAYPGARLTTPIDLSPLSGWFNNNNSITNLSDFLSGTYNGNEQLTVSTNLSPLSGWFNSNNSITNLSNFFSNSHTNNIQLATPIDLSHLGDWFNNNNSITDLSYFLYNTHSNNFLLTTPITLPLWSFTGVTNLSNFLVNTHSALSSNGSYFSSLATPIDLSPLSGWFNNNNSITNLSDFLSGTYNGNEQLTVSTNLSPLSGWFNYNNSIIDLSYFLSGTHSGNTQLTTPLNIDQLSSWFDNDYSFNNLENFLSSTHKNNPNITLSGQAILPNWIKTAKKYDGINFTPIWDVYGTFYQIFYLDNSKSGDFAEIKFMDGTPLSSLGRPGGDPGWNLETYTNRTGISPVNLNWQ